MRRDVRNSSSCCRSGHMDRGVSASPLSAGGRSRTPRSQAACLALQPPRLDAARLVRKTTQSHSSYGPDQVDEGGPGAIRALLGTAATETVIVHTPHCDSLVAIGRVIAREFANGDRFRRLARTGAPATDQEENCEGATHPVERHRGELFSSVRHTPVTIAAQRASRKSSRKPRKPRSRNRPAI